jgi:electron transfer flavoprotein alpha subunit
MAGKVWAYVDQFKGEGHPASWEVVAAGRKLAGELGTTLTAVVFGDGIDAAAKTAIQYGADDALAANNAALAEFRHNPYASQLAALAKEYQPEIILFPTTTRGRELAGMVAIDLETGVLPDVIGMKLEGGMVVVTRPVYAGKLLAKSRCEAKPQLITLRARSFEKAVLDESRGGEIAQAAIAPEDDGAKVLDYATAEGQVSLTDAAIIVSGGRGTSNRADLQPPPEITDEKEKEIWRAQQGFKLIGALAETLGAAVGASRAAVDAGYVPYSHQVGQTGKVVGPDLYIACGISGAIQHQAGMRTSKVIVAINKDADAPIFKLARFGVVGDLYDIVPALTAAFKERLG